MVDNQYVDYFRHVIIMAKRKSDSLDIRTSQLNKNWDEAVGKALDMLPSSTLPTHRNVLQRYRYIRTEDRDGNYKLQIYISIVLL